MERCQLVEREGLGDLGCKLQEANKCSVQDSTSINNFVDDEPFLRE